MNVQERGIDGLVSEASSLANQELLRKKGYEELARIEHSTITDKHGKQIINCDDGTTAMILFFKRINSFTKYQHTHVYFLSLHTPLFFDNIHDFMG
ncbi:unnamed protein product [Gongylonema pulchrum]|uniref:Uncharacterized protein n=1 Tax=Gongylonema pulchrum TaxID=637853 RepID=A0A183DX45_9BILA|nr:unnamed protein product [Gongylonema pulchrum]